MLLTSAKVADFQKIGLDLHFPIFCFREVLSILHCVPAAQIDNERRNCLRCRAGGNAQPKNISRYLPLLTDSE